MRATQPLGTRPDRHDRCRSCNLADAAGRGVDAGARPRGSVFALGRVAALRVFRQRAARPATGALFVSGRRPLPVCRVLESKRRLAALDRIGRRLAGLDTARLAAVPGRRGWPGELRPGATTRAVRSRGGVRRIQVAAAGFGLLRRRAGLGSCDRAGVADLAGRAGRRLGGPATARRSTAGAVSRVA